MRNLRGYLLLEWKLLFRGPVFWICCLLCGVMFYLFSQDDSARNNIGSQAMDQSMFLFVLFLMGLLLSMQLARRDVATRSQLILGALPARQWQLHAARILSLSLPLTLIALVPAGLFAISVIREGIPLAESVRGIAALATSVVPTGFVVVTGYAVGSLTGRRWIYLIGLAGFLMATYLVQFLLMFRLPGLWLGLLDFTQLDFFATRLYSSQWGFMQEKLFWLHRASYLGFTLTLLFLWITVRMRRWKERKGLIMQGALACMMAVCTVMFVYAYLHLSMGRMEAVREELDYYRGTYEAELYTKDGVEIVSEGKAREAARAAKYEGLVADRYDLAVYPGKDHQVEMEASVRMTNGTGQALEKFPVTLRHLYAISSFAIDGEKVEYEREPGRDYVWVTPAAPIAENAAVTLELHYGGRIDDWRYPGFDVGYYSRASFVDADRMLLSGTSGWFPIPGISTLTVMQQAYFYSSTSGERKVDVLEDRKFTLPPADYRVRVISDRKLNIIPATGEVLSSNHNGQFYETVLQADRAPGFTLVAGPLRKVSASSGDIALSLIIDRWWLGQEAELRLADIARQTESIRRVLGELWPRTEAEKTEQAWPAQLTLMTNDSVSLRGGTGPNAGYQPEFNNADGLVGLIPGDLAAYNKRYFSVSWVKRMLEHHAGKRLNYTHGFAPVLSAYALAILEPTREASIQTFKDNLNLATIRLVTGVDLSREYVGIFEQSTDEEFRQFLQDYYEMISDESLTYKSVMEKEKNFITSRAEAGGSGS